MTEIWELSVVETVEQIRRGALSPADVVRALLDRLERLEPALRAWQALDAERALRAAEELAKRQRRGEPLGSLAGVAVGLKDLYDVAGLPTTAGTPVLADRVARRDSTAAARLRGADALLLGKTVTTPFAYADPAETRNPWQPDRTPGGSSSGSAAAVAARMVPAALGTQTAGSGLRPAAYCGVVAIKPSYGRVSRRGILPLSWSMDTPAVHARSVADALAILAALAGPDPADPVTLRFGEWRPEDRPNEPPRLGLVREMVELAEPVLRAHLEQVTKRLEGAGARVEEVRLPFSNAVMLAVHHVIQQVEAVACHRRLFADHADFYPPRLRAYLEVGEFLPASAYVHAQRIRRRIFNAIADLLSGLDGLLLPVAEGAAPPRSSTGSYVMLAGWTMLGLPAVSLPSGLSAESLPLAVQLVGRHGDDARLGSVAAWCEAALGQIRAPDLAWTQASDWVH